MQKMVEIIFFFIPVINLKFNYDNEFIIKNVKRVYWFHGLSNFKQNQYGKVIKTHLLKKRNNWKP